MAAAGGAAAGEQAGGVEVLLHPVSRCCMPPWRAVPPERGPRTHPTQPPTTSRPLKPNTVCQPLFPPSPQLVLLSMSDHYLRVAHSARAARSAPTAAAAAAGGSSSTTTLGPGRAVGMLFGVQRGATAEIFTSSPMLVTAQSAGGGGGGAGSAPRYAVDSKFVEDQRSLSAYTTRWEGRGGVCVHDKGRVTAASELAVRMLRRSRAGV